MEQSKLCGMFKALSDENRLHIVTLLCSGEQCACKLLEELNIGQSTLSHHMKILCDAGLVTGRKEGKWMHYSICSESAEELSAMLYQLLSAANVSDNCCCKEK